MSRAAVRGEIRDIGGFLCLFLSGPSSFSGALALYVKFDITTPFGKLLSCQALAVTGRRVVFDRDHPLRSRDNGSSRRVGPGKYEWVPGRISVARQSSFAVLVAVGSANRYRDAEAGVNSRWRSGAGFPWETSQRSTTDRGSRNGSGGSPGSPFGLSHVFVHRSALRCSWQPFCGRRGLPAQRGTPGQWRHWCTQRRPNRRSQC
jgi:hypothetical protein